MVLVSARCRDNGGEREIVFGKDGVELEQLDCSPAQVALQALSQEPVQGRLEIVQRNRTFHLPS